MKKTLERRVATLEKLKAKSAEQHEKRVARYDAEIASIERAKAALAP